MKKRSLLQRLIGAPYVLWAAIFIVVPLFIVLYYSFTDADGTFTFANIRELGDYKEILWISIEYSVIATVITLIVSYPFAYVMSRKREHTQRIMMLLVMVPMWMNLLILTYSWMNILEKNGLINTLLGMVHLPPLKLIETPGAVIFGMIYNYIPYMVLPIYSVMSKIDPSLLEAAEDLGSGSLSKLRRVILPLSVPGVVSGVTMVFVPSITAFTVPALIGNGAYMLYGNKIETAITSAAGYHRNDYSVGSTLSIILLLCIVISTLIMNHFDKDKEGGSIL